MRLVITDDEREACNECELRVTLEDLCCTVGPDMLVMRALNNLLLSRYHNDFTNDFY